MAEWLTSPNAWFTFVVEMWFVFELGYVTRGTVERWKRDRRNRR